MKAVRATLSLLLATTAGLGGVAAAALPAGAAPGTGDRPEGVAFVRADSHPVLNPDGTITVTQRVKCDPAWQPAELDVQVSRSLDAYASGYTIPAVPCDDAWHSVTYTIGTSVPLTPGKVTISSQFLVTNVVTGDSAGAHDTRTGRLSLAR